MISTEVNVKISHPRPGVPKGAVPASGDFPDSAQSFFEAPDLSFADFQTLHHTSAKFWNHLAGSQAWSRALEGAEPGPAVPICWTSNPQIVIS